MKTKISAINSIVFFTCLLSFNPFLSFSQIKKTKRLDSLQISRIADFGKVWGVINYFHPASGKGVLNTDNLVIGGIGDLLSDPSAKSFKASLKSMFAKVGDPYSGLIEPVQSGYSLPARHTFYRSQLSSGQLYLAIPQQIFQKEVTLDSIIRFDPFKQIFIIDLRNSKFDRELGMKQYTNFVQPLLARLISKTMILPADRSFYYHGLMRQDFPQDLNILLPDSDGAIKEHLQVFNGFRNISEGSYLLSAIHPIDVSPNKFCFIVNKQLNINTLKALMALRNRNLCRLIFEGELPEYILGNFYTMHLSDGISVKIRTSEVLYEDGTLGTKPDLFTHAVNDTSLKSIVVTEAVRLLKKPIQVSTDRMVENTAFIRKPQYNYPVKGVPDQNLRVLGLFNFWNAIYYFSPNKNLIPFDWSKALPAFIPDFLSAETDSAYFLALMKLTAAIKDGHSILMNTPTGRSPLGFMDGNLPIVADLVDGKFYITSILPDTAQQNSLSQFNLGDELLAIDNLSINQLSEQWRYYLAASNTAGFNREFNATWLTAGSIGSTAAVTVSSRGTIKKVSLLRVKRDNYYNLRGKVIHKPLVPPLYPPYCKILAGNIGYMRINRIYSKELDSLSEMLKNCRSIILDARGYPRDSRIGSNLSAYIAGKIDTVAYDVFPFIVSPDLSENYSITQYQVIKPNQNQNLKHKKYYILADEGNQSQGEWNVIALQGVTNATTIGSQTAGANGMAVTINFPGEYFSFFSGFGEYYPDHTPNQKLGVKIDIQVKRTLKGYLEDKDEIMETAIKLSKGYFYKVDVNLNPTECQKVLTLPQ